MAHRYTEEQLNTADKSLLIQIIMSLQDQTEALTKEVHDLNDKMQLMLEQIVLAKKDRFGRSSEKMDDAAQIRFMEVDGTIVFFNEAEAVCDLDAPEPQDLSADKKRGRKKSGKKEEDLSGLKVNVIGHYLSEEELIREFGEEGWYQLEDTISRRYKFIPASVEVDEHHIGVYKSRKDGHMLRAPHPKGLLHGSPVSSTLAAAIMNGKYVNAVPLYRLEKEFERYGLSITRQNMANWMIRLSEEYLSVLYDYLHKLLYDYHVIQADETTCLVNRDGRAAGAKSYMWVYRTGYLYTDKQIVLYEYQKTRNAAHPRKFLSGFKGICVTDGYQVYHTIEKEREDLTIAGCWVHTRRKFNDALFLYLKQNEPRIQAKGKMREAFNYALNQEKYLKVFLTDGDVPMDNNASERAIRGFTVGRKNWQMIDTINGANASAVIYSIAETAKANNLKPYEYFEHLLSEIPKHMDDHDLKFMEDLLPWSPALPDRIRKNK